jgi:hypothetical protein
MDYPDIFAKVMEEIGVSSYDVNKMTPGKLLLARKKMQEALVKAKPRKLTPPTIYRE